MKQILTESTISHIVAVFKTLAINNDDFRHQSICLATLRLLRAQGLLTDYNSQKMDYVLEECVNADDSTNLDPDAIAKEVKEILEDERYQQRHAAVFEGPVFGSLAHNIANVMANCHTAKSETSRTIFRATWNTLIGELISDNLIDSWRSLELLSLNDELSEQERQAFDRDTITAAVYKILEAPSKSEYFENRKSL